MASTSGLSTEAQRTISNAVVAAFRTFLNPDAVQRVQSVVEQELGLTSHPSIHPTSTHPPSIFPPSPSHTTAAHSPGPSGPLNPAVNGKLVNGKAGPKGAAGKRKREDKPERKPRPLSLFNLFQAKVMRMVKESGELDKNQRLLTVTSGLWKTTQEPFKEHFKSFYMPLLEKFNVAKSGGNKMDLHHELVEFEKSNPPPREIAGIIDKLVSNTAPLPPLSPAPAANEAPDADEVLDAVELPDAIEVPNVAEVRPVQSRSKSRQNVGVGVTPRQNVGLSKPATPVVPALNGVEEEMEEEEEDVGGGEVEVEVEREAKTPVEQPKKKKKKSKDAELADGEQSPVLGTTDKKKKKKRDSDKKKDTDKKDTEKKRKKKTVAAE